MHHFIIDLFMDINIWLGLTIVVIGSLLGILGLSVTLTLVIVKLEEFASTAFTLLFKSKYSNQLN
ncbi:hypothetical protein VCHA53O466_140074 [Vibrio chagasii]|nr:hypothetical protein VCHA53O466_140074 [Vibrio chagasii]